jgi:hypothetical protein
MDKIPFADHTTVDPSFNLSFKKGGRVKSMGKAKRGGGVAIK